MTIAKIYPNRGAANPFTRSGGVEEKLNEIIDDVNAFTTGAIEASDIFGVQTVSEAVNTTLAALASTNLLAMTASGKAYTLPAADTEPTIYEGGQYLITNSGANAFAVKASGGATLFAALQPGDTILLVNLSTGTAAGSWTLLPLKIAIQALTGTLSLTGTLTANGQAINMGGGAINMGGGTLTAGTGGKFGGGELFNYIEPIPTLAATPTVQIDCSLAGVNKFELTHDADIDTVTFINRPADGKCKEIYLRRVKDANATARTIGEFVGVTFTEGAAPALTQASGAIDTLAFVVGNDWADGYAAGTNMTEPS